MSKIKNSLVAFGFFLSLVFVAPVASYGQPAKPPSDVHVINPGNDPVPGRDVDNPARQPFTKVVTDSNSFAVPSGKRLVIEYVSGGGFISTGQKFLEVGFLFTALIDGDRAGVQHHFVPVFTGTQNTGMNQFDVYAVSQQTRIYVEPGGLVQGFLEKTSGVAGVSFTVSGYLVDVP